MINEKSHFEKMKENLLEKAKYHEDHRELYNGQHEAKHPLLSVPKEIENAIEINLEWVKVAVEYFTSSFMVDAFSNDGFGFTRLLNEQNGWNVISSGITSAINSACSFIAVIPQSDGLKPLLISYSGSEATGVLDSTGTKLKYGLAVHKSEPVTGEPLEYLVFSPGFIQRVTPQGERLAIAEMPLNEVYLVPFIFNSSIDKPFGRSLIGRGAVDSLENAQRSLKLTAIINEFNAGQGYMLFASGIDPEELKDVSVVSQMGRINALFTEDVANISLEKLMGNSTTELQALLNVYAKQFASATFSPAYIFGVDPENGAMSSETTARQDAPRQRIISNARESFGESVKQLAILSMGSMTGEITEDFYNIKTLFRNPMTLNLSDLGAFGDAIQKLTSSGESFIPQEFLKNQLGIPIRDDLLNVSYPNFDISNKLAEAYKNLDVTTSKNYGLEKRDDVL